MRVFYFSFFVQFFTFPIKKGKYLVYFYNMGEDCGTPEDFPYQSANHPKACFPVYDFLEQWKILCLLLAEYNQIHQKFYKS